MIAKQEVAVMDRQARRAVENPIWCLVEDMLKHILDQLWSKSDADVSLVKSANPVKMELEPNVRHE